jgi:hypothetical protein
MKTLSFPEDLRGPEHSSKPYVRFSLPPEIRFEQAGGDGVGPPRKVENATGDAHQQVCLFMPEEVSISNNTNYTDSNIGIGAAFDKIGKNLQKTGKFGINTQDLQVAYNYGSAALNPLNSALSLTDRAILKSKLSFNERATTVFDGIAIREYSLSYTFAPSNENESFLMSDIESWFRKYSLPSQPTEYTLKTPPLFDVDFMVGENHNQFYPMYYHSFLTSVDASLNPNGKAFFANGAPTSMTLSLNFKESEQVTRDMMFSGSTLDYNTKGMRPDVPVPDPVDVRGIEELKDNVTSFIGNIKGQV